MVRSEVGLIKTAVRSHLLVEVDVRSKATPTEVLRKVLEALVKSPDGLVLFVGAPDSELVIADVDAPRWKGDGLFLAIKLAVEAQANVLEILSRKLTASPDDDLFDGIVAADHAVLLVVGFDQEARGVRVDEDRGHLIALDDLVETLRVLKVVHTKLRRRECLGKAQVEDRENRIEEEFVHLRPNDFQDLLLVGR